VLNLNESYQNMKLCLGLKKLKGCLGSTPDIPGVHSFNGKRF